MRKVDDGWAVGREISSDVESMSNVSSSTCVDCDESPSSANAESPKMTHRRGSP